MNSHKDCKTYSKLPNIPFNGDDWIFRPLDRKFYRIIARRIMEILWWRAEMVDDNGVEWPIESIFTRVFDRII